MSTVGISEALLRDMRVTDEEIVAELMDGRTITVPLAWSWRLSEATPEQRANVQIIGNGQGAHWPDVDEDISARGMLAGIPAPRPNPAVWSVASPDNGEPRHVVLDRAIAYDSVNVRTSSSEVHMAHSKETGKAAASKASSTLSSKSTGKRSKSAAGSALSQTKAPAKTTSSKAASAASKTLRDGRTSAGSKSAAGSALSQKHGTRGGKK